MPVRVYGCSIVCALLLSIGFFVLSMRFLCVSIACVLRFCWCSCAVNALLHYVYACLLRVRLRVYFCSSLCVYCCYIVVSVAVLLIVECYLWFVDLFLCVSIVVLLLYVGFLLFVVCFLWFVKLCLCASIVSVVLCFVFLLVVMWFLWV